MYSMVLMAALTTGTDMPDLGRRGGGCRGCYGGMAWGGCYGGWGGCYGGWGGCYGGWGGCYGGMAWGGGYRRGYAWGGFSPWSGYAYAPMTYGYSYSTPMIAGNIVYGTPGTIQSFYYSPGATGNEANMIVHLPPDATLTIDGQPTQSVSDTRLFVSPPLEPGKTYHYTLRGEVNRDGRKVNATKTVEVQAGRISEVTLDFPGINRPPERLNQPAPRSDQKRRERDTPPPS